MQWNFGFILTKKILILYWQYQLLVVK
jgi:hypothetical protein